MCLKDTRHKQYMMTSSNRNIFCVTDSLCGEFTGHKAQWRGALMFSLICAWKNCWVNSSEAGDLRRHHAHYDLTVMKGTRFPIHIVDICMSSAHEYLWLSSSDLVKSLTAPLDATYSYRTNKFWGIRITIVLMFAKSGVLENFRTLNLSLRGSIRNPNKSAFWSAKILCGGLVCHAMTWPPLLITTKDEGLTWVYWGSSNIEYPSKITS